MSASIHILRYSEVITGINAILSAVPEGRGFAPAYWTLVQDVPYRMVAAQLVTTQKSAVTNKGGCVNKDLSAEQAGTSPR